MYLVLSEAAVPRVTRYYAGSVLKVLCEKVHMQQAVKRVFISQWEVAHQHHVTDTQSLGTVKGWRG